MHIVWVAAAGSLVTSAIVAAFVLPDAAWEVMLGMAGPLVIAVGSFVLMERTHRRSPEGLTRLLVRAFLGKMVFFGLYIGAAVAVLALEPIPFVSSFTVYFVVLHLAEAVQLQRMFVANAAPPSEIEA